MPALAFLSKIMNNETLEVGQVYIEDIGASLKRDFYATSMPGRKVRMNWQVDSPLYIRRK